MILLEGKALYRINGEEDLLTPGSYFYADPWNEG